MRALSKLGLATTLVLIGWGCQQAEGEASSSDMSGSARLNPMITLHERGEPVFGLYTPRAAPRMMRGETPDPSQVKTPAELAEETIGYGMGDYVFYSAMEGGVDAALPEFTTLVGAMREAGATARSHPFVVKMEKISEDPEATRHIGQQLEAGVSGIMFVEVESADELRQGLAAMRFADRGGTRDADVGMAPAYWGVSEEEYRSRADLWPLDPEGELIAWVIIESREGLANLREIAAVPGIGVLWPGAGTLRGVFSEVQPDGTRVFDEEGWEAAIQAVLDACQEFDLHCGYPAGPDDIERRMEQGFDVFVMNWGDAGFRTVEVGRSVAGR